MESSSKGNERADPLENYCDPLNLGNVHLSGWVGCRMVANSLVIHSSSPKTNNSNFRHHPREQLIPTLTYSLGTYPLHTRRMDQDPVRRHSHCPFCGSAVCKVGLAPITGRHFLTRDPTPVAPVCWHRALSALLIQTRSRRTRPWWHFAISPRYSHTSRMLQMCNIVVVGERSTRFFLTRWFFISFPYTFILV